MTKTKLNAILIAIIGILFASDIKAQIWQIGNQNMTFVDPSRGNRQIETKLFYPADVSGVGVPLGSPANKKYPVVVFGHDQNISWNNYAYVWNALASKGFIIAIPKTEMGASMNVVEYAKDMAFIVSQFSSMHTTPGTFFYQRYMGTSCVMGHGIGGSAATFAVQYNPAITIMVSLAATETSPSAINAATMVNVPSVVMGGGEDCNSPIATNQMPMFNNIDSDCKYFVSLEEASHCHFAQNAGYCTASQVLCYGSPNSVVSTNYNTTYLIVSFLRYYLKYNAPALAKFEWKLQSKKKDWTYIIACNLNAPREQFNEELAEENNPMSLNLYPNPVASGTDLNLVVNSGEATAGTIMITNLMGQVVSTSELVFEEEKNEIRLPVGQINSGHYMVSIITDEGRVSRPLIIR